MRYPIRGRQGYVPTVNPQRIPTLDGAFAGYQCGVSPTQQMQLGWYNALDIRVGPRFPHI